MAQFTLSEKLCNASASGNLPLVCFLLQNGADVNGRNRYNRTALQVAMLGSSAVVEALLEAGAHPDLRDPASGRTVLHDSADAGFRQTVGVLLDRGADANVADHHGNLPLHLAARGGHREAVRMLLPRTANPGWANDEGKTFTQLAVEGLRREIAKYLKTRGF